MKRKLLILIMLLILPGFVNAYELTCDTGLFSYNETFNCRIQNAPNSYEYIKGTLTENTGLECKIISHAEGLEVVSESEKHFEYTGNALEDNLVNFECKSVSQNPAAITSQIFVNDFTYKILEQKEENLLLRSDYINLNQYIIEEEDTKPRDTTNADSLLASIKENQLNQLNFSRFVTQYNLEVVFEVEELNLDILPLNSEATIKIEGNQKLELGKNIIDIYVTSPDGSSTTCYTLTINRLPKGETVYIKEQDSKLKTLTISGFTINFESEIFDYKIHLNEKQSSVVVNATPNYSGATVDVSKYQNLQNGDIITITVTSEDGSNTTKYRIKVTKDLPKKDYTSYFIVAGITITIILIILLIVYTSSRQKKDPLLSLKTPNKVKNKGAKFNKNAVPEAPVAKESVGQIQEFQDNNISKEKPEEINQIQINQPLNNQTEQLEEANKEIKNIESIPEEANIEIPKQNNLETNIFDKQMEEPQQETNIFDNPNLYQNKETNIFDQINEPTQQSETVVIPTNNTSSILPSTPTEPKLPRDQGMIPTESFNQNNNSNNTDDIDIIEF